MTAALLALAGCGSSSSSSTTATVSSSEMTRAADVSSNVAGYKAVMSMTETLPSVGSVTMHGTGSFGHDVGAMTMNMTLPGAASAGLGSNLQIQLVIDHDTFFMKMPAALTSKIPGGKPWWSMNLSQLGKASGIPGIGSMMSSEQTLSNPGEYLNFLRATASGSVQDLGSATVDGVQTTHYRGNIDFSKVADAFPASERAAIAQTMAAVSKHVQTKPAPIDVWIDANHLVRRLTFTEPLTVNGQSANVAMQMDFLSYGTQPAPAIPPAGQVTNLLALLHGTI
jgi:hypothetical protein